MQEYIAINSLSYDRTKPINFHHIYIYIYIKPFTISSIHLQPWKWSSLSLFLQWRSFSFPSRSSSRASAPTQKPSDWSKTSATEWIIFSSATPPWRLTSQPTSATWLSYPSRWLWTTPPTRRGTRRSWGDTRLTRRWNSIWRYARTLTVWWKTPSRRRRSSLVKRISLVRRRVRRRQCNPSRTAILSSPGHPSGRTHCRRGTSRWGRSFRQPSLLCKAFFLDHQWGVSEKE